MGVAEGGDGVCEEERQLPPNGGKKGQLVTKSLVQPSLPRGESTSVIRFLLTIYPNLGAQCCPSATGMRTMTGGLPGSSCSPSTLSTNFEPF